MGKEVIEGAVSVALAIVGVAIIAVLVSKNANTSMVVSSAGGALATGLTAAEGPVTNSGGGFGGLLSSAGWTGGAPYMSGESVLG